MKPDDRIRAAYRRLADRVAAEVDPAQGLARITRRRRKLRPALAAAALVAVLIGGVALVGLLPGREPAPDGVARPAVPSTTTSVTTPQTDTSVSTTATEPGPRSPSNTATLFRVDTERVAADTSDPFLNVRVDPDPDAPILAKLPPAYSGIRRLGDTATTPSGSVWYLVELEDPVPLEAESRRNIASVTGWVNSAFLVPLPEDVEVTAAELAPCEGGSDFARTGATTPMHVSSLRMGEVAAGCTRIVVGFSTGEAAADWIDVAPGTAPATAPPSWQEAQAPWPLVVRFPDTTSVWPDAAGLAGAYLVRQPDRSLSLVVTRPADEVWIRTAPGRGLLVIDLRDSARPQPPARELVALLREPRVGSGRVEAAGVARPFEANLEVWVEDETGTPVEAVFSGSPWLGTRRTADYAVPTIDWLEAWAPFALRVDGLAPGRYHLVFDGNGDGSGLLRVPFTIDRAGDPPPVPSDEANEVARRLIAFAGGGDPPALANEVVLRLADQTSVTRSAAELSDPSRWVVDTAGFAGRDGPIDLLEGLRDWPNLAVSEQRLSPRCGGEPVDWWPYQTLPRLPVVLTPVATESCLEWYSLSVLADGAGTITTVVLDLYEP